MVIVVVPALATSLEQNYPNPFNPETTIHFALAKRSPASLAVYASDGRRVRVLLDESLEAGHHEATWNGRDDDGALVGSGIYFYQLRTDAFRASKKMVLLK